MLKKNSLIHKTADVSKNASIGANTYVWHESQIREGARVGRDCVIAKGVYVDKGVVIGDKVKVQNYASIYGKAVLEDGVFIGPYVCLTNDKLPRSITPDGKLKKDGDWDRSTTTIMKGASLGTGTIVLPGIKIGSFSLVGAGSLVAHDVPPQALIYGSPAKLKGYVCKCGAILTRNKRKPKKLVCRGCVKLGFK